MSTSPENLTGFAKVQWERAQAIKDGKVAPTPTPIAQLQPATTKPKGTKKRTYLPRVPETKLTASPVVVPPDGDPNAIAARRLAELTPMAVRVLEHEMRTGNSTARQTAAKFVLESQGHGKKDGAGLGAAPVVLLNLGTIPWQKPAIEAEVKVHDAPNKDS